MRVLLCLALSGFLVLLAPGAKADEVADSTENRMDAAERYLAVANLPEMLQDMVNRVATTMPQDARELFITSTLDFLRMDVLENAMLASMTRHFTVKEMDAMAAFYGTPEGQSVLKKFGVYMADVMPIIQTEVLSAVAKAQSEMSKLKNN